MNLQKIGAYIAQKRKELGMTQAELADKLGMSNKSVSKWERGVCLPDVSMYMELCNILGITINEFIAGEDLQQETFVEKSDENIITVTKDGKKKRRHLKALAVVLAVALVALSIVMVILHMPKQNYIEPLSVNTTEMTAAELVTGHGDVHLYRFSVDDSYKQVWVTMKTYEKGQMVFEEKLFGYPMENGKGDGMIAIVSDFNDHDAKVAVYQDDGTGSVEMDLLDGVKNKEIYNRSFSAGFGDTKIAKGEEKGLVNLVYDKDESRALSADVVLAGATGEENDYMYLFTVTFE